MPVAPPQTAILALEGEIDLQRSPDVKAALEPLLQQKTPRILIDMGKVKYIDSSGLAVLIEALQRLTSYGGSFALFNLQQSVRHIFEIARLDQIFRIFPDEQAAQAEP